MDRRSFAQSRTSTANINLFVSLQNTYTVGQESREPFEKVQRSEEWSYHQRMVLAKPSTPRSGLVSWCCHQLPGPVKYNVNIHSIATDPNMPLRCLNNKNGNRYSNHISLEGWKTLIFDLDETLLHTEFHPFHENNEVITVDINNMLKQTYILIRPGASQMIAELSKHFEIGIFTASAKQYALPLIEKLGDGIDIVLYRDHCTVINGEYKKDLRVLRRDLSKVILVDNSMISVHQRPNTLQITDFVDDLGDHHLERLIPFLKFMQGPLDVRPVESYYYLYNQGEQFNYLGSEGQLTQEKANVAILLKQHKLDYNPAITLTDEENGMVIQETPQTQKIIILPQRQYQ